MVGLAKEATTVGRMLEPLCCSFDEGNHWSPQSRIACSVLSNLQSQMENSDQNSHLLLSILVKHLDHKNVMKKPSAQVAIVNVFTHLAEDANLQVSVAITGAIVELIKQLRKWIQCTMEISNYDGTNEWNGALHSALEECLKQFSKKPESYTILCTSGSKLLADVPNLSVMEKISLDKISNIIVTPKLECSSVSVLVSCIGKVVART